MSVLICFSNTRLKSVAKWYKCLINELVKQIILYRRQNGLLSRHYTLANFGVSLIVFQHSTSHDNSLHIHMVHFLLFLHQNCSLVTGSLRKLYSKWDNEFFLGFLLAHPEYSSLFTIYGRDCGLEYHNFDFSRLIGYHFCISYLVKNWWDSN